jgi:hypothetical protein
MSEYDVIFIPCTLQFRSPGITVFEHVLATSSEIFIIQPVQVAHLSQRFTVSNLLTPSKKIITAARLCSSGMNRLSSKGKTPKFDPLAFKNY